VPEENIKRP